MIIPQAAPAGKTFGSPVCAMLTRAVCPKAKATALNTLSGSGGSTARVCCGRYMAKEAKSAPASTTNTFVRFPIMLFMVFSPRDVCVLHDLDRRSAQGAQSVPLVGGSLAQLHWQLQCIGGQKILNP